MKNNNLQKAEGHLFNFGSAPIRAKVDAAGMPWFNANDVCAALGLTNPHKALADHVDPDDVTQSDTTDNLGRKQLTNHVNESGLYTLIFGSRKDSAKRFKRWVTSEVLPSIRKTGEYVDADLKARIAHLKSQNEALQIENEAIHDTLQALGTSYEALHAVENSIIRNITKAPGEHKTVQLQKIVMAEVTCTEQDFWHAVTDLYNRYKIKQNEKAAWVLAR